MRPIDAEPLEYLFGISDEDNYFYLMLKNAPTIDTIPVVHGQWSEKRWITEDDWGVINHRSIVCSACKGEIADGEQTRYCPNCGARMDGGTANETD